jgi:dipeptidyl aminopeptidase/acylaminoacyl peptidase
VVQFRQKVDFGVDIEASNVEEEFAYRLAILDVEEAEMTEVRMRVGGRVRTQADRYVEEKFAPRFADSLPKDPEHFLVLAQEEALDSGDLYKVDVETGRMEKETELAQFEEDPVFNTDGEPIAMLTARGDEFVLLGRPSGSDEWRAIDRRKIADREAIFPEGASSDPNTFYAVDAAIGDKGALVKINVATGEREIVKQHSKTSDLGLVYSPRVSEPDKVIGYEAVYDEVEREIFDPELKPLYDAINAALPGQTNDITSATEDLSIAIIYSTSAKDPGSYYLLFDRKRMEFLGNQKPLIQPNQLGERDLVEIEARDGLMIPTYITTPPQGASEAPYPTIMVPHGGPWARDFPGFDEWAQFLASHGYLVLQPQFRGSTGFGERLWKAGDAQWGGTMQDDLDDVALWAVDEGLARRDELGIFGWSYGGYAAFAGAVEEDPIWACAAPGAGVVDLTEFRSLIAGSRVGRLRQLPHVAGLEPVEHIDNVSIPVLMVHGDDDFRVPVGQSRRFWKKFDDASDAWGKYVELEGAGHFFYTLYYPHKKTLYENLLKFFSGPCGMDNPANPYDGYSDSRS